jgi:hypothetical protein
MKSFFQALSYPTPSTRLSEPSTTNWRERWKPLQIESKDGHRS